MYMEKDAFFYYLQHAENEFEKFLLVFEKIAKNCFRVLRIFPQIHRSVEITVAIELYKCIVKIVVNLISFSNFPSKMQLHETFLCEKCFYDTYFFQENRPPLIHYRM